jgi:CheY-like chemotaxis protein
LEVEDTGAGIAQHEMDALFDPFIQTASGQRSQEGTGLGLPISRQFVSLMGGELSVASVVGQGTVFRVHLTLSLADAGSVEAPNALPKRRVVGLEPDQTAPDGGSFRLLIVEDKATNRDLLRRLLEPLGCEVRIAVNGAEGVTAWETWQPHLVWMDMRMPVLDGYAATRQIKARTEALGRPTVVVALTASAFEENRSAILAAGCDDFVRKPFQEYEIFDVLHRHLGMRFIYEERMTTPPQVEVKDGPRADDVQALLTKLPQAWADELCQAASALDADRMLAIIDTARPRAPQLADRLAQWVDNFEYDRIIALLTS